MNQSDFLIVGAGSAGCILARRLARDFGKRVTLIEVTSSQARRIDRERPARWMRLLQSAEDWDFVTKPAKSLAKRALRWPRGRGVGGSSRINAMIWFPPTSDDANRLCEVTGGYWKPDRMLAALASVEELLKPENPSWLSTASKAFLDAAAQTPHSNPIAYRRLQKDGKRNSLETLLQFGMARPENAPPETSSGQIKLIRGTVDKIQWRGDQAVGIKIKTESGNCDLACNHGVILTAGTIGTPAILMRSGVGPKDTLSELGIAVHHEKPAIGKQVRDHLIMPVIFRQRNVRHQFSIDANPRNLSRWQLLGTGPISSNLAECGGLFLNNRLQLHVTPTHYLSFPKLDEAAWMSIGVNVTQPKSSGHLRITSLDPIEPPEIHPNYLNHEDDLEATVRGVEFVRELAQTSKLSKIIESESLPGNKRSTEQALIRSIQRYSQTLYHPLGSCAVGCEEAAPVDPEFRLRNSKGLWIVDGSIFPGITMGNPNATIMTLAWMAAEEIIANVDS